jgi:hypothetical protein
MSVGSYPKTSSWELGGCKGGAVLTDRIGKRAATLGPKKLIPDKGETHSLNAVATR